MENEYNLNVKAICPCWSLFNSPFLFKEEDMSKLTDLVIVENATILQLLSICNLSKKINYCDVPYKNVLVAKIRDLLNNIWWIDWKICNAVFEYLLPMFEKAFCLYVLNVKVVNDEWRVVCYFELNVSL